MKVKFSLKQGIRARWDIKYDNYPSYKFLQYKTLSLQFLSRPSFWFKRYGYGTGQWPWCILIFAWIGLYYSHDYVCHVKGKIGPILVKSTSEG